MDIENFSQCLNYMQSTLQQNSYLDKGLPIVGTLAGTIFGFALNFFASKTKESAAVKNKLMCITEDIESTKSSLITIIKECSRLLELIVTKQSIKGSFLPKVVTALSVDAYFISVADNFTRDQRYCTQLLLARLVEINDILLVLKQNSQPNFDRSIATMNLISLCIGSIKMCEAFLTKKRVSDVDIRDFLASVDVPKTQIDTFNCAVKNANNANAMLHL
jgi:hypothetical protein